ncbi:MAG: hypothetical protein ACTHK4_13385 [Mycobacteriales bacterium]
MRSIQLVGVIVPLVAFATACGGSSSGSESEATDLPSVVSCPSPPETGDTFPVLAASRVPHPAFAQSPKQIPVTVKGQSEVQFTTAMPLRDAAAFVHSEYPAAGYRIVGGDAETHEADIVWSHEGAGGKTKLSQAGPCSTTWTVLTLP